MKNQIKLLFLALFFIALSCEKETIDNVEEIKLIVKDNVKGFVQKGPFINGTSITVAELTTDLNQTGKVFSTQISDNRGSFELKQLQLSSQYVELKADGFYFNEISGEKSTSQLTLYALSDLMEKNNLNVNILSHLEKGRIGYLVSNQNISFAEAKKQAQTEILQIFSIDKSDLPVSELLDISKDGDDNAVLLALSVIIQGFRTDAELSELIANIATDIKEDGILNSESIGTQLINHTKLLNLSNIRQNLVERYEEMGIDATIPNFEKYVQMFIENTDFVFSSLIEYPQYSDYGENILYDEISNVISDKFYSLAANLPNGTELKVELSGGMWYYALMPDGPVNWKVTQYDDKEKTQTFTSIVPGEKCDLKIQFRVPHYFEDEQPEGPVRDTITINYYENKSEIPTKTKSLIVE